MDIAYSLDNYGKTKKLPFINKKLAGKSKNLGRCVGGVMALAITPRDEF